MNQKGFVPVLVLVAVLGIAAIAGGAYYLGTQKGNVPLVSKPSPIPSPTSPAQKACTQEAKLCPDGTYVSRVGPNCEFAPCPTLPDSRSCKSDADCRTSEICTRQLGWHPEPGETVTAPPMVCISKQ